MSAPPFHAIVHFHRRKAQLSQAELAELAGVGKTVIFDVEHGKRTVGLATLEKILSSLGVTLEWNSPLRAAFETDQAGAAKRGARP